MDIASKITDTNGITIGNKTESVADRATRKTTKIKKHCLMLACLLLLTACGKIDDDIPGKSEVLAFTENIVPQERYKFDHVEHVSGAMPKEDIYYFESKDRDLEFTVVSTLKPVGIDATIAGYDPCIYSEYAKCVHELYLDDIEDVLDELDHDSRGRYRYYSYAELEDIVDIIIEADEIYSAESKYNDEDWMEENPVDKVSIYLISYDEDGDEDFLGAQYVKLTGNLDYDEVYERFCDYHIELIEKAGVEDTTIP